MDLVCKYMAEYWMTEEEAEEAVKQDLEYWYD